MDLQLKLSQNQISQIAKMLSLNLQDIKHYIDTHKEEYEQFLKEEQEKNRQKSTNKQYAHIKPVQEVYNQNKQKTYDTTTSIIWNIKNKNRKKELK